MELNREQVGFRDFTHLKISGIECLMTLFHSLCALVPIWLSDNLERMIHNLLHRLHIYLIWLVFVTLSAEDSSFDLRLETALKGNAQDQAYVGMAYLLGKKVPKNPKLAFHYLQQAAGQGNPEAQNSLGWMFARGVGTPRDIQRAMFWYEKAAKALHGGAMNNLGMLYFQEDSIADDHKGWVWLENSAKAKDPAGMTNLARYLLRKDSSASINRVVELLQEAAERTHPEAALQLGILYMEGKVLPLDEPKALKWLYAAALGKLPEAMERIGWIYEHASSIEQDPNQSRSWYQRAVELGLVSSLTRLGELYLKGRGVPKDPQKAIEYLEKAANQKNPEAQRILGLLYYHGQHLQMDAERACDWLALAAAEEDGIAQHYLGIMHESGRGCKRNLTEAMRWYSRAIKNGWWQSRKNLSELKKRLTHPLEVMSPLREKEWKGRTLPAQEKVSTSRFSQSELDPSRALLPISHLIRAPMDSIVEDPQWEEHRGWKGLDFRYTRCFYRKSSGFFQWSLEFRNRLQSHLSFSYALSHPQQNNMESNRVKIDPGRILQTPVLTLLPCGSDAHLWVGKVFYEWRGKLYPLDQRL